MKHTLLTVFLSLALGSTVNAQSYAQNLAPVPVVPSEPKIYGQLLGVQPVTPLKKSQSSGTPASQEVLSNSINNTVINNTGGQPTTETISNQLKNDLEEAASNFKERYPKTKVLGFALTPVRGLYEATVGKEVVYFDKSARFLFTGRLLDIEKGIDLTDAKLKEIRRVDISKLPLDLAIKQVKGNGQRQLVLFTDVDCPFSRKLSNTLEDIDNVTIWTFLFPLTSLHPEAKAKSDAVWCNKDSNAALDAAFKGANINSLSTNTLCNSPVEEIIRLGNDLGIGGTPTLINGAGDRSAGAIPLDKLEAFISAGNQRKEK